MTGAMKLQSDDGPRSSLSIGPGSHDAMGSRRSSLGDLPKGSGSSPGTLREIAGRRSEDSSQECRRLPDRREYFRRLTRPGPTGKLPVRLSHPGRLVNHPYLDFRI
ncbi:hypothetical protein B296_00032555 [Ensete ventricosum]|uniref:Uncharacterized protein n=1 Tax=Ensete ventricosum TaxID=4639 RepID=A0A426YSW0_ENSVE|nr:hypothetical protein B296_00032555 [Ensete ventricosum]